jgi:hypothetical protein
VIYGTHEVGGVLVKAPVTEDFASRMATVMVIENSDVLADGTPVVIRDALNRSDVERLRDLCEEALS